MWRYLSETWKITYFVCDCTKAASKYVVMSLHRLSGLKILVISAEKAAVNKEIP